MKERSLKRIPALIGILATLCFAGFTAYQTYLFVIIERARFGRLLGITAFVLITLGSLFGLFRVGLLRYMRNSLFVAGFGMNFVIKLINIPGLFGDMTKYNPNSELNLAIFVGAGVGMFVSIGYFIMIRYRLRSSRDRRMTYILMPVMIAMFILCLVADFLMIMRLKEPATVFNVLIFVFAQIAVLVLLLYYLFIRHQQSSGREREQTFILMPVVILLYLFRLVLECLAIARYGANINNGDMTLTLISRFLYCFGFVGTAIRFMLVAPRPRRKRRKETTNSSESEKVNQ